MRQDSKYINNHIKNPVKRWARAIKLLEQHFLNIDKMVKEKKFFYVGEEVICPNGLGRVIAIRTDFPFEWVQVETYSGRGSCCKWSPYNIKSI